MLFFGKYTISENGKEKIVLFKQKIFDYTNCNVLP